MNWMNRENPSLGRHACHRSHSAPVWLLKLSDDQFLQELAQ